MWPAKPDSKISLRYKLSKSKLIPEKLLPWKPRPNDKNSSVLGVIGASFMFSSFENFPCQIQTPSLMAWLVYPSWLQLQCFIFAPCRTQTPPFLAMLVHPSWLQILHLPSTRFFGMSLADNSGAFLVGVFSLILEERWRKVDGRRRWWKQGNTMGVACWPRDQLM